MALIRVKYFTQQQLVFSCLAVMRDYCRNSKPETKTNEKTMPSYTKDDKQRFITLTYFGTTDSPDDDVNPHTDVNEFLEDTIGHLRWGTDSEVRNRSKQRFADTYNHLLDYYHVELSYADILKEVMDDDQTNQDAVDAWLKKAVFPPKP
jgi:hypothetical protein